MFLGPKAASPPKNILGWGDCMVVVSTMGMSHLSNWIPISRSIQGKEFSWPTATSTSSHSITTSGSPDGTRLRRPLASYSAFTFSNLTPVSLPFWCRNSLGTMKLWMGMPSCMASSFSQGDAFISSKPERTTTSTCSPPMRRAERPPAIAVLPPPRATHALAAAARRGAAAVHGGVAAAEHDHALADLADMAERHRREPVDADVDVLGRFLAAGNVEVASARCAGADKDRVPAFGEQRLQTVDALAGAELDAEAEHIAGLFVDNAVGEAEFRYLRADHAARFLVGVKHDASVAERRQIARHGQRGGTAADQRDTLAVFLRNGLGQPRGDVVFVDGGDSLETADRDRFVFDAHAPAGRLTGAVASASEDSRKHVRAPIDHVGVFVTPVRDQTDVFWNGRMRRARPLAIDDFMKVLWRRDCSVLH